MISYIRGELADVEENKVIVEQAVSDMEFSCQVMQSDFCRGWAVK